MTIQNTFGVLTRLKTHAGDVSYYRLAGLAGTRRRFRVCRFRSRSFENLLRACDGRAVTKEDVLALARWRPKSVEREIGFTPARVVLQDFTGVPCVVDLAAMRAVMKRAGNDPKRINPIVAVDLVIDHSVQVDSFGTPDSFARNVQLEFSRNRERYAFLRWAQRSFENFSVVPPGTGIVHQVNLEYLAKVVQTAKKDGEVLAFPDTLVGTDSHTTMINGLGVLGWGVGGIEAEACMLGLLMYMLIPEVVGFKLSYCLPEGTTATDLVFTVTEICARKAWSANSSNSTAGLSSLGLPDRATIANMAPEYGATMGFFPVDDETLRYLRLTGTRRAAHRSCRTIHQRAGPVRRDGMADPIFTETMEFDLSKLEPSIAGPRRPQDRVTLPRRRNRLMMRFTDIKAPPGRRSADFVKRPQRKFVGRIHRHCGHHQLHQHIQPIGPHRRGILAKKAREKGLTVNIMSKQASRRDPGW